MSTNSRKSLETDKHRSWFERWHENDRNFRKTSADLSVSEKSLFAAANRYDWRDRADARDAELDRLREKEAVKRQQRLLERQRKAGELLRMRGMECLMDKDLGVIRDPIKAIKAVQAGIELERQAEDLPTWMFEIRAKTDEELLEERNRLLRLARIEAGRDRSGDEAPEDDGAEDGEEE